VSERKLEIQLLKSIRDVSAQAWDACACPEAIDGGKPDNPFTTHRFLRALEDSGSVGDGSGWITRHLAVYVEENLIACAPFYVKLHSQGEYVFDHSWANAYTQAGGQYYPKLQGAVPFTPVSGKRFLTRPGYEVEGLSGLVQGAVQVATNNGFSSVHFTFCTEAEALAGEQMGLQRRIGQQFHWVNDDYPDFESFLNTLSARKRKNVKRERRRAGEFGGEIRVYTGNEIRAEHWDYIWEFYQDTGARKWGQPYLTRQFFDNAQEFLRDDILLIFAERDGIPVAGAMNFIGRDALYGRYWGCTEEHDCLHFEICYYQSIDYAIRHGLGRVEAGAQGEHKLARGYLPVETHSLHWIEDKGFSDAVARFLVEERAAVSNDIDVLTEWGPFKKTHVEEQE
jgi:predicted N-acyltransferase